MSRQFYQLYPPVLRRMRQLRLALLLILCAGTWAPDTAVAGVPPPQFTDTLVTNVNQPTDLAFTPDGRLLIISQSGRLFVYQNGALLSTPALNLSGVICSDRERGMLGIAVDPNFAGNSFIYLYYTFNRHNNNCPYSASDPSNVPVNRVSRFTLPAGNTIDPTSEVVLVDNIVSLSGNHNAGGLEFGADGLLYISVGDSGPSNNARLLSVLNGKMLRVGTDGSIPTSNPYASSPSGRRCGDPAGVPPGTGPCTEIIAYGLRNPFRFSFRPGTNEFFINDVGAATWEEIDQGEIGVDYGWNVREGPCAVGSTTNCSAPPAGMTNPIFSYNHSTGNLLPGSGCAAITSGTFVPAGIWPEEYDGAYLFSDLICGAIFRLVPAGGGGGGYTAVPFVTGLGNGGPVAMVFGPYNTTQALYYLSMRGSSPNQVRRVAFTGTRNRPPGAAINASPASGAAPLEVTLSAAGSSDPDGDPLTFDWDFGDGATMVGTTSVIVTHTYTVEGVYTPTLTVHDDSGGTSAPATTRIDVGNSPPVPAISAPAVDDRFAVGETLTLTGSAVDEQDGSLPDSALRWEVLLHHVDEQNPGNAHVHPFLNSTPGNNLTITAPAAEDLGATALSYLELRLTATDQHGLSRTITRTLEPNRVTLRFESRPAGLVLGVDSRTLTAPQELVSWEGQQLSVLAADQSDGAGNQWVFWAWSDGGAASHTLSTPGADTSYAALFRVQYWLPMMMN